MKKALVAVVATYFLGVIVFTVLASSARKANIERTRTILALSAKHAAQPGIGEPALKDACKGKLEPGGATNIMAFINRTPMNSNDENTVDEVLVGTGNVFSLTMESQRLKDGEVVAPGFGDEVKNMLNPVDWTRHLKYAKHASPDISEAKYLVVATYGVLRWPVVSGSTFIRGSGDFLAQVLTFPEGRVVCEGRGEVHTNGSVTAHERTQAEADSHAAKLVPFVFSLGVRASPLHDVCDAGGADLCKATSDWTSR